MIDFSGESIFEHLKKVDNGFFETLINDFLIDNEKIIESYQGAREGVVFTTKRIITVNVQGITGKKKDFTSIPYNKITTFSLQTSGIYDVNTNLEIFINLKKIKFEFTNSTNVEDICKTISTYTLK